jgi:hypothetical protein
VPFGLFRSTPATIAALLALLGAGCHEEQRGRQRVALPARVGPPGLIRVALAELPWPLDPALAEGRDATTVARALFATPLRIDPRTGALLPGLCRSWNADATARTWRFRCRRADAIAAALRRVARMRESPWRWLFAPATRIEAAGAETLVVRLRFPWRRFPYALTMPAAAPRELPGPFRVVATARDRIVAERPGLRLVFLRLEPRLAAHAFRRGVVDEAPVPVGRLLATRADPVLGAELRVRPLRAVDVVDLGTQLDRAPSVRLAYWRTAQRADYEALVPEFAAPQAFGLVRTEGAEERASPRLFRSARESIESLPRIPLGIEVELDPEAVYRAQTVWASWRDLGLAAVVIPRRRPGLAGAASFRRLVAAYPLPEALLAAALLPRTGPSAARRTLVAALAARDPLPLLARADEELQADARVIPVAWVADARLVSRRLEGWRQDALGVVDYSRLTARGRAPSRSR